MSGSAVVGIDVSKAHVDVVVIGAKLEAERLANEVAGHSALAAAWPPLGVQLVVMEAPGGYETALACALQAASLAVAVLNPKRARQVNGTLGQDRSYRCAHLG
jgi:transposase